MAAPRLHHPPCRHLPHHTSATSEIDTQQDRDAQAVFERAQQRAQDARDNPDGPPHCAIHPASSSPTAPDDNSYHGQAAYQKFNERKDTHAGNAYKGIMQIGLSLVIAVATSVHICDRTASSPQ